MTSKTTKTASSQAEQENSRGQAGTAGAGKPSRLDQLQALLASDNGASIAEMTDATGWQVHSVRGAMAGALKKRGLVISSDKVGGVRRYRAEMPA